MRWKSSAVPCTWQRGAEGMAGPRWRKDQSHVRGSLEPRQVWRNPPSRPHLTGTAFSASMSLCTNSKFLKQKKSFQKLRCWGGAESACGSAAASSWASERQLHSNTGHVPPAFPALRAPGRAPPRSPLCGAGQPSRPRVLPGWRRSVQPRGVEPAPAPLTCCWAGARSGSAAAMSGLEACSQLRCLLPARQIDV